MRRGPRPEADLAMERWYQRGPAVQPEARLHLLRSLPAPLRPKVCANCSGAIHPRLQRARGLCPSARVINSLANNRFDPNRTEVGPERRGFLCGTAPDLFATA